MIARSEWKSVVSDFFKVHLQAGRPISISRKRRQLPWRQTIKQLFVCDSHFSENCLVNLGQYQSRLASIYPKLHRCLQTVQIVRVPICPLFNGYNMCTLEGTALVTRDWTLIRKNIAPFFQTCYTKNATSLKCFVLFGLQCLCCVDCIGIHEPLPGLWTLQWGLVLCALCGSIQLRPFKES